MTATDAKPQVQGVETRDAVNDFAIVAATVNGSGSQTANTVLIRAIFKMGIPVNGKNLFPSNIAGLPTWYTIRVSKQGYTARRETTEVLVAFNPQTAAEDLAALPPGGVCFYPDDMKLEQSRSDVIYYPLPVKELVKQSGADAKLRDYVANMVYVGALAQMLNIEMSEIEAALNYHFGGKRKAVDLNMSVVQMGFDWTRDNLQKRDPYRLERMDKTGNLVLIDGNTAGALGAVFGGVSVVAWYPITPATSLADALGEYLPKLRKDPATGEATYAIVQAEDELAAIGMAVGAGWAGVRAMTSTSGPGISLMAEFTGAAYFAEIPVVIWDVQRVGPSTGLPTRTSQADLTFVYFLGHGDTRHVCLLPGTIAECFEFGYKAFDLAERLQTPVFVLSDLDLGMNLWMTEPFKYPEQPMDRGKVLTKEDLQRLGGKWGRYVDVDGDSIGYRTLPGNEHPAAAYFTRGSGHNAEAKYSERPEDYEYIMDHLARKHQTARSLVPKPVVERVDGAEIGLIGFGSTDAAIIEGRDRLHAEGIESSYLRLRALPFEESVEQFLAEHERIYVIELNHEGQLRQLLAMDFPQYAAKIVSLATVDGLPLTARRVSDLVKSREDALGR